MTDALRSVVAVVLTHRRPRLATQVVAGLIDAEGIDPQRILVVVNGEGGLADPELERRVAMLRLPANVGPAGGFAAGLREAVTRFDAEWVYLCEDDVGLLQLPVGRIQRLLGQVEAWEHETAARVGAVVAYGRRFAGDAGHTLPYLPAAEPALQDVDVAAWGASLVHRRVVDAGILPDPDWFFGYEDFDFFLRLRAVGLALLVDAATGRAVADEMSLEGRAGTQVGARPEDAAEAWRAYYVARNFVLLARRHGDWRWLAWHLIYSLRRVQLARVGSERWATVRGLADGFRGRSGRNPRYMREVGEFRETVPS